MTAKATRIKRLLEDPDLLEAFDNVQRAILNGWMQTPPSDIDSKEEWHRRLFTLQSVEENLKQAIRDGELDDFKVAEQGKLAPLGDIVQWRMKEQKQQ